jgi:hypothetical protein
VCLIPVEGDVPVFRTLLGEPASRRMRAAVRAFSDFVRADVMRSSGAR